MSTTPSSITLQADAADQFFDATRGLLTYGVLIGIVLGLVNEDMWLFYTSLGISGAIAFIADLAYIVNMILENSFNSYLLLDTDQ